MIGTYTVTMIFLNPYFADVGISKKQGGPIEAVRLHLTHLLLTIAAIWIRCPFFLWLTFPIECADGQLLDNCEVSSLQQDCAGVYRGLMDCKDINLNEEIEYSLLYSNSIFGYSNLLSYGLGTKWQTCFFLNLTKKRWNEKLSSFISGTLRPTPPPKKKKREKNIFYDFVFQDKQVMSKQRHLDSVEQLTERNGVWGSSVLVKDKGCQSVWLTHENAGPSIVGERPHSHQTLIYQAQHSPWQLSREESIHKAQVRGFLEAPKSLLFLAFFKWSQSSIFFPTLQGKYLSIARCCLKDA